jgi:hypothetical protein
MIDQCPLCGRDRALVGRMHNCVTKTVTDIVTKKIGRPRNPDKLTNAQKQAAYRLRNGTQSSKGTP